MREAPPQSLVDLLGRLGLAVPAQIQGVQGRVRRLARGLPGFEQVWVDALAQARVLTPYQAAEINAGRADSLVVGSYLLCQPVETLGWGDVYRACDKRGGSEVRMTLVPGAVEDRDAWTAQLTDLLRRSELISHPAIEPLTACGFQGARLWTAGGYSAGQSAAEWIVHHGRLTPALVEQIARQMAAGLSACETASVVHGDISARQLWFTAAGQVRLVSPGLRGIVVPGESYANCHALPETYDYLAPERIADGTPPTIASDIYACGALWWHLLAGRPPLPGALGLAKMQATQTAKIVDIALLAPETPTALAEIIRACMARDPRRRPASFAELAARVGSSTSGGERVLAQCLDRSSQCRLRLGQAPEARSLRSRSKRVAAVLVGFALIVTAGTWPQWQARLSRNLAEAARSTTPSVTASNRTDAAAISTASETAPRAGTQRAAAQRPGPWPGSVWEGEDLVLAAGEAIEVGDLPLRNGQVVRAPAGARATVRPPLDGWRIEVEGVQFRDVDFVAPSPEAKALVLLACRRAEFHGCSWQGSPGAEQVAALVWTAPEESEPGDEVLTHGELRLSDCLLQHVGVGVRRNGRRSVIVEAANVLHLGPGPFVQFDRAPQQGDQIELILSHVTLRDCSALVACHYRELPAEPGRLIVSAQDCAFLPSAGSGLIIFSGAAQPSSLLSALEWVGSGSVLSQQTPLAVWRDTGGLARAAADDAVQAAGLVRSDVGFAGDKGAGPSASRVVRWQVPLQSTEPPGIRDSRVLPAGVLR